VLEYYPQGLFERTGNIWRAQGRRARLEFQHFKRHAMTNVLIRQEEVEGWRGEIRDSEVVKTHEEALEEEGRSREDDADTAVDEPEDDVEYADEEYDDEPEDDADYVDEDETEDEADEDEPVGEEVEDEPADEEPADEEPAEEEPADEEPADEDYQDADEFEDEQDDVPEDEPEEAPRRGRRRPATSGARGRG